MSLVRTFLRPAVVAVAAVAVGAVARPAAAQDIVETAVAAGQFTTLAKLLGDAGLVETLKGTGPFTVFAPTDAAFAKVPKATLDKLAKDKEALKRVLLYHVVAANVLSGDLKDGPVKTVAGPSARVSLRGQRVRVDGANVIKPDVVASNGVIHVVDRVLLPPAGTVSAAKK